MFKLTRRRKIAGGIIVALIGLFGFIATMTAGNDAPAAANPPAATATATASTQHAAPAASTPAADPYAVYLATAPAGAVKLSREDAQTRAYLGCGQTFAPGTIDAALAAAYRPTGLCNGHG